MKKFAIIILLLAAVLCAGCAAGNDTPEVSADEMPAQPLAQQQLEDTGVAADAFLECRITVNPALCLYMDTSFVIQRVECLNADAEALCRDLALQDLPCQVAFGLLVQSLQAGGYFDGNQVQLQITLPQALGAQLPQLQTAFDDAWTAALAEHHAACNFLLDVRLAEEEEIQTQPDPEARPAPESEAPQDDLFDEVERDSAGNIVRTVGPDADGNRITAWYDAYPTPREVRIDFAGGGVQHTFYGADQTVEREITVDPQGAKEELFYQDGALVKAVINDGLAENHYTNGVLTLIIERLDTGTVRETCYSTQGVLLRTVETGAGWRMTREYHPTGWLQRFNVENAQGGREEVYQADGVLLYEENRETGQKNIYDAAGNKTEAYDIDNYGRSTHVFWLGNGDAVVYVHESDGSVTKSVMMPDGSVLSEIQNYTGPETAAP